MMTEHERQHMYTSGPCVSSERPAPRSGAYSVCASKCAKCFVCMDKHGKVSHALCDALWRPAVMPAVRLEHVRMVRCGVV